MPMTRKRRIFALLLGVLAVLLVVGAWLLLGHSPAPVDPAWAQASARQIPAGAVTVRFSGVATLLFSDGETAWMTDGFFSRPGPLRLLFGEIEPDLEAIERGLRANDVTELAAVLPMHSHYDHAMDAPEVARRTGAVLMGSESTANIGRGWGLPEPQIQLLRDREPVQLGRFVITPIVSRHFEFPDPAMRERILGDPTIRGPLTPPAPVFDYRVGEAYVLHVAHPRGTWLIVGSAGFEEGALEGLRADTVFLGIAGLGAQTDAYRDTFWRETVGRVSPRRVIPIHYESLTAPAQGLFLGPLHGESLVAGGDGNMLPFLRARLAEEPELVVQTLPRFGEVVLFE